MVQHAWVFILVLLAGLLIALIPHHRTQNGKTPRAEKEN